MLGSFRFRLFLVLVVVALVLTALNSGNRSGEKLEPVLEYIMKTDYQVGERLFSFLDSRNTEERFEPVPVTSSGVVKRPCRDGEIERHYGWYWNADTQKQEFNPGIVIRLADDSPVTAALGGTVEDIIVLEDGGREVLLRHAEELQSIYGGLKEVLVKRGEMLHSGDDVGTSGGKVYFELRNKERPLNPETLFE